MPEIMTQEKEFSRKLLEFFAENNLDSILVALRNSKSSANYFDLSIEDKSKISYLRGDRVPEDSSLIYDEEYRRKYAYHGRIGRLLNGAEYDAEQYKRVCELLYLRGKPYHVRLRNDICELYHEDSYSAVRGELGNSCMRHDNCQSAIGFYQSLGADVVQLAVILADDGAVLARGLFWHCVKINTDDNYRNYNNPRFRFTKYLDRVYAIDSNIASAVYQWAEAQNIPHYKEKEAGEMRIEIPRKAQDTDCAMPYFDTFRYCDECLTYLSSYGGDVCLDSTECYSVDELVGGDCTCAECGARMCEDDAYYVEDAGSYCSECAVYSDVYDCNIRRDDAGYSEHAESWIDKSDDNYQYSECHSDWIHIDNLVYCEYEGDYILYSHAVELHNGDYTHQDNAIFFEDEDSEGYYLIDECISEPETNKLIPKEKYEAVI